MLKEQDKTMSKFTEYLENNSSIITEAKTAAEAEEMQEKFNSEIAEFLK